MAARAPLRRSAPALLLAVVLLAGSSLAATANGPQAPRPLPAIESAENALAGQPEASYTPAPDGPPSHATRVGLRWTPASRAAVVAPKAAATRKPVAKPASPKPTTRTTTRTTTKTSSAPVYRGTNHLWIPALGINRSVGYYYCGNPNPPGLGVYRWGCAGRNNTYLLAHAFAAFKPLHDAYVQGRLRKGMKAIYADGGGHVHTYVVIWWRLTTPDNGAFAYASLSSPSMTLQTCVGAYSQYRLIVRLARVS
jgi:hypothetical protein